MKQSDVDPNFKPIDPAEAGWNFLPVESTAARIDGLPWCHSEGHWNRLPRSLMENPATSPTLCHVAAQQSGGRIVFRSSAPSWALRASYSRSESGVFNTHASLSGIDVYYRTSKGMKFLRCAVPPFGETSFSTEVKKPADAEDEVEWTLYFPLQNPLTSLELAFPENCPVLSPAPHLSEKPILFYGSSITQGFSSTRPGLTYPAIISRRLDINFINLGFGGNAKGEPEVAAAIAELDMSFFVCDLEHNIYDLQELETRHAPFVSIIRQAHPHIPILVVSAPNYWNDPTYFGKRADVLSRTVDAARANGDNNITFLHGRKFWNPPEAGDMTVDRTHPNDAGFACMASVIGARILSAISDRTQ